MPWDGRHRDKQRLTTSMRQAKADKRFTASEKLCQKTAQEATSNQASVAATDATSTTRASWEAGFVRWATKPASRLRRMSSS